MLPLPLDDLLAVDLRLADIAPGTAA